MPEHIFGLYIAACQCPETLAATEVNVVFVCERRRSWKFRDGEFFYFAGKDGRKAAGNLYAGASQKKIEGREITKLPETCPWVAFLGHRTCTMSTPLSVFCTERIHSLNSAICMRPLPRANDSIHGTYKIPSFLLPIWIHQDAMQLGIGVTHLSAGWCCG